MIYLRVALAILLSLRGLMNILSANRKSLIIFSLVFAGEMIFSLPFHIARFFRPTFLEVFELSNTNLGDIFAVYGVTAMLAYFPGGAIADYFSTRRIMTFSLVATALGGVFLSQIPSVLGLSMLFAYWGVTTILLFWAAMIKETREWGGSLSQGLAFGILDGGRGLVAAAMATVAVFILSQLLPSDIASVSETERIQGLKTVITFYTLLTFGAALLIWHFIPEKAVSRANSFNTSLVGVKSILRKKVIWLQAVIVVCAYCAYKGLDNYALYAVDILKMNELEAARFSSSAAYIRPVACLLMGLVADRFSASRVIGFGFLALLLSYISLISMSSSSSINLIYANVIVSFVAVYGLRGVYFALLEESKIEVSLTGTAAGVISFIGFTPDIFFGSLTGRILDSSTGLEVYQYYFALLAAFSLVGMIAAFLLARHFQLREPN